MPFKATATPAKPTLNVATPAKPTLNVATPAKPTLNVADALAAKQAHNAHIDAQRALAGSHYAGASLAIRKSQAASRALYVERVSSPVQRVRNNDACHITLRDESALLTCVANSKAGAFEPATFALDTGALSRLASIGYVTFVADAFTLSTTALAHARTLAARVAKKA